MVRKQRTAVAALVPACIGSLAGADIIDVPGDQPTIQAAIDIAIGGDLVLVSPGTYVESLDFLGKAITVRSVGGLSVTTIEAEANNRAVICITGEGPATILDGFTLTGGFVSTGGALHCDNASPTLTNCALVDNLATAGGAVFSSAGSPTFINCILALNAASFGGAGIRIVGGGTVTFTNCTFVENTSQFKDGGAVHADIDSAFIATNCIFRDNMPGAISGNGVATITYSNVQGGWPGDGNIDVDPLFVDSAYRLAAGSPCIDAGDSDAVTLPTDADGACRVVDDPATIDTGIGGPPIVDMGAYEVQACPADFDADEFIGVLDLLSVLGAWGNCPGCPQDLDGDDEVGVLDLLALLGAWGPCCTD